MAKTRNPQDATLRNVRAAKKRDTQIERRLAHLESQVHALSTILLDMTNQPGGPKFAEAMGRLRELTTE